MDKRHMDRGPSKVRAKTEEALAAIGFGEIGAITVLTVWRRRNVEERAKAKAEAEELVKGGEVKLKTRKL